MAPEELRLDLAVADEISLVHQSIHEGACVVATRRAEEPLWVGR